MRPEKEADRNLLEEALRESEERFRVAAQISSDLIYEFDLTTGSLLLLHESESAESDEIPRTREAWEKMLHPEDRDRVLAAVRRTLETDHPFFEEYRVILSTGAVRVRAGYGKVLRDAGGRPRKWIGVNKDLTERRKMEAALRDSESRYRQLFERNLAGLYRSTADGTILDCNDTFARMYGFASRDEVLTVSAGELYFNANEREAFVEKLEEKGVLVNYELRGRRKDGSAFWLLESVTLDRSTEPAVLAGTILEITDRKEAEQKIEKSRGELRELSRRLSAAREEERARVAREIHDELGQRLTVLKMAVARLRRALPREPATLHSSAQAILASIDDLLRTVRDLSTELRPSVLDHLELLDALKWQARDFESRTGIRCRFRSRLERVLLDSGTRTDLYRVTQEALTNVARHAGASFVRIQVSREAGDLLLEITDNGTGITEEEMKGQASLGLLGIRERIQALGGTVSLTSTSGRGTKLSIRIPLSERPA